MKNYLKVLLSVLIFSVFSVNAESIDFDKEKMLSNDCHESIKSLTSNDKVESTKSESSNNLNELILGRDKDKLSTKKENIKKLAPCFSNIVESDIALKILRILYGEVVNIPVGIASSQFLSFFDIKSNFDENKFNEGADILSYLPEIIGSFNYLVFSFAVIFVTLIYGSKFFKMMSVKGQATTQHFAKNNLRIILGLSSIFPLAFINNLTFIQFIFLCLLVCGVLLSKILWMFMLLSLNYTYIDTDIMNKLEEKEIVNSFLDQIDNNISIHFCDFKNRNAILQKEVLSDSYEDLISNDYYKCLVSPANYGYTSKLDVNSSIYIPEDIKKGEFCAKKFQHIEEKETYCGQVIIPSLEEHENTEDKDISNLRKIAIRNSGVNEEPYQKKIRDLAYSYYKFECRELGGSQEVEAKKPFKCPKIKSDGSIEYNSTLNKVIFENERFLNQSHIDSFIQSEFPNKYISIGNNFEDLKNSLSDPSLYINEMDKVTYYLVQSYNKGFLMAGNIFYEKAQLANSLDNKLEGLRDIYTIKTTEEYELPNIGFINNNSILIKTTKQSENSFLLPLTEIMDSKENANCALNYSDCYMSSINPFTKLMNNGNQMLSYGIYAVAGVTFFKTLLNSDTLKFLASDALLNINNKARLNKKDKAEEKRKIESNRSSIHKNMIEYMDFIAAITYIFVFIGIFFAFILPFIPFFIFASLVFSWFVQTFKILILSGLLSVYMLIPNEKNDGFAGKEEKLYKLFVKTALTPILILCGFLITILLANLGISILNIWFSIIIDYFNLKGSPENLMDYINIGIALGIYLFMVTKIVIKASESIAEFPVAVSKWLDIDIEDERVFNKIKGMFESYVVPSISKFIK